MSRVGYAPIEIPAGVTVDVAGATVTVKGPKGTLTHVVPEPIGITVDGAVLEVSRSDEERESRALHGLTRALLANMVTGVSAGFTRELQTVGVGYRAALQGSALELQVGFSHSVRLEAPEGVVFEVPDPNRIVVRGIDKAKVGQAAADIRAIRPPEPYKGKGIRYVGETVRRKAGKAGLKQ
jgi:large subunit ribosomal protein L6